MLDTNRTICVSIPHTGTRFIQKRLRTRYVTHTTAAWDSILELCKDRYIIAPLRDPKACWASTVRRMKEPNDPEHLSKFYQAWYTMHALSLIREIDFIPVDLKQDPRITDWEVVGSDDLTINDKAPGIYFKSIYQLPFVKKYYSFKG